MVAPLQGSTSVPSPGSTLPASSAGSTGTPAPATATPSSSGPDASYGYADASGMNPAASPASSPGPGQARFARAKEVSHQLFSHHELRAALATRSAYRLWKANRTALTQGQDLTSRAGLLREWSRSLPPGKLTTKIAKSLTDAGDTARSTRVGGWLARMSNESAVASRLNAIMDKTVGLEVDAQQELAYRTNAVLDKNLAERFPGKTMEELTDAEQSALVKASYKEATQSLGKDAKELKSKAKAAKAGGSAEAEGLSRDAKVASKAKSAGGFFGWLKRGFEKVGEKVGGLVEGAAKLAERIPVVGEATGKLVRFAGKAVGSPVMLAVNGVLDAGAAVKAFANPKASWAERFAALGAVGCDAVGIGGEILFPGNPLAVPCLAGSLALGLTRDTLHDKAE